MVSIIKLFTLYYNLNKMILMYLLKLGSDLMERYRELNKDIERLHEWRQNQIDTRETYIQLSNQLAHRRRQLISELNLIYPISQVCV